MSCPVRSAREAAKKRGDSQARAPRRRRQRVVQHEGREPSGFAAVLQGLMADRAWELPATGGTGAGGRRLTGRASRRVIR
ncbi:hypothetical protein SMD11_0160 [Streptomyces albireticuli]|uniref:Uncharacterized protein n=1 Tax=Streptomyces albireticuli TaxID=1940 RepID=A0A1Z2KUY9_9ACTN|nr:hypothetical protein [Streptomyces albireticuli]ARZ65826.1 hypothetical protein SMD11_0160 [Streptomyces albireticuli]